jgi:hypothetical protein
MSAMPAVVLWKWEIRDARRRSGWRLLSWRMAEEDAAAWEKAEGTELRRVEASREELQDPDGRHRDEK